MLSRLAMESEFVKQLDFEDLVGVFAKLGFKAPCIVSYVGGSRSGALDYNKQNSTAGGNRISKTSNYKLVLPRAALPPQGVEQSHDGGQWWLGS